jgi:hypothetical protein
MPVEVNVSRPIPDHLRHLIQTTTEFEALPDPRDIFPNGGVVGLEYAYVLGHNIGFYTDPRLPLEDRWELVRGAPVYRIGPANNVLLICRGLPVPGADPASSCRTWYVDPELDDLLSGMDTPPTSPTTK